MNFSQGGELQAYVKGKKYLSENEAKSIVKQITEGLKYIHSRGVIHRDLNPNNILFTDENHDLINVSIMILIQNFIYR